MRSSAAQTTPRNSWPLSSVGWFHSSNPDRFLRVPEWLVLERIAEGQSLKGVQAPTLEHLQARKLITVTWWAPGVAVKVAITEIGRSALRARAAYRAKTGS